MITNYFMDLWEKAEKLGVKKASIGREMFKDYRQIYCQGKVSKYMQKRHDDIDLTIEKLAKKAHK